MYEDSNNNNLSKELENQIPTEYNEEQKLRIIRKQNEIPGESRTKTLNDLTTAVEIGQVLKDLSFPVNKKLSSHMYKIYSLQILRLIKYSPYCIN